MIASQDLDQGVVASASGSPLAIIHFAPVVVLETLRQRSDFLKAASARRQSAGSFMLQARARVEDLSRGDNLVARVGFTASKKIGNAVARNRAKRRLRAAVHEVLRLLARPGWDYVLVARPEATIARPYADLVADLRRAVMAVHRT